MEYFKYNGIKDKYLVNMNAVLYRIGRKPIAVEKEIFCGDTEVIKEGQGPNDRNFLLIYLGTDGRYILREPNFSFVAYLDEFEYLPVEQLANKENVSYSEFVATLIKDYDNIGIYLNGFWNLVMDIPFEKRSDLIDLWWKIQKNYYPENRDSIPVYDVLAKFVKPLEDSICGNLLISPVLEDDKGYFIRKTILGNTNGNISLSSLLLYDMVNLGIYRLCNIEEEMKKYKSYETRLEEQRLTRKK